MSDKKMVDSLMGEIVRKDDQAPVTVSYEDGMALLKDKDGNVTGWMPEAQHKALKAAYDAGEFDEEPAA